MTTANLNILTENDYALDDNDYIEFEENLMMWTSKWIPEIAFEIAKNKRDLFGHAAIRMLVNKWAELERKDKAAFEFAFQHAGSKDYEDMEADDFKGIGTYDKASYSEALRMLIIA